MAKLSRPAVIKVLFLSMFTAPLVIKAIHTDLNIHMHTGARFFHGDLFAHIPARYAIFRRGDYRNRVSVFTQDADYTIKLDGDNTRLIDTADVSEKVQQQIIDHINAVRMSKP